MVTNLESTKSTKSNLISEFFTEDIQVIFKIIILNGLGLFFVEILFPFIVSRVLNLSATYLGLVITFIVFGNMLSAPFAGYLADKYSKKRMVAFGSIGRGISYFVIYLGIVLISPVIFYIGTLILGFLTGFFWIPLNSLISQKSHKYHRSEAFGRRDYALGVGQFIGGILGLGLFGLGMKFFPTNYYLLFLCMPLFGVANLIAASIFMKNVNEAENFLSSYEGNTEDSINKIQSNGSNSDKLRVQKGFLIGFSLFLFAFFVSALNGSLAKPFYQLYILKVLTDDPTIAILIYAPTGLFGMIFAPKLGKWADKLNPKLGLSIASICGAVITLLIISFNSLWFFMILLIFDVAINNTSNLLLEQIFSRISKKHRGKAFGLRSTAANFGGLIGPLIGGLAWDYVGIKIPFIISIFVELSLIPLFFIALKELIGYLEEK